MGSDYHNVVNEKSFFFNLEILSHEEACLFNVRSFRPYILYYFNITNICDTHQLKGIFIP